MRCSEFELASQVGVFLLEGFMDVIQAGRSNLVFIVENLKEL